jgi:hypothetical protein
LHGGAAERRALSLSSHAADSQPEPLAGPGVFSLRRARGGEERLWKVWWFLGIPLACVASALLIGAEALREAGAHTWGNALDLARLAVYWFWFRLAWHCSRNVRHAWWTAAVRVALLAGLAVTALT